MRLRRGNEWQLVRPHIPSPEYYDQILADVESGKRVPFNVYLVTSEGVSVR